MASLQVEMKRLEVEDRANARDSKTTFVITLCSLSVAGALGGGLIATGRTEALESLAWLVAAAIGVAVAWAGGKSKGALEELRKQSGRVGLPPADTGGEE